LATLAGTQTILNWFQRATTGSVCPVQVAPPFAITHGGGNYGNLTPGCVFLRNSIRVPAGKRSAFLGQFDQDSWGKAITIPAGKSISDRDAQEW
jgi:hypothetical protein